MKKTFHSKVEPALALPVCALLLTGEFLLIRNELWFLAILVALVSGFFLYLWRNTFYELTADNKLRIKVGFFYDKEIYIKSIKKVRSTRNHLASPALSTDRLEIRFNRYESVMVSPDHRHEFIRSLREKNPKIAVDEPA